MTPAARAAPARRPAAASAASPTRPASSAGPRSVGDAARPGRPRRPAAAPRGSPPAARRRGRRRRAGGARRRAAGRAAAPRPARWAALSWAGASTRARALPPTAATSASATGVGQAAAPGERQRVLAPQLLQRQGLDPRPLLGRLAAQRPDRDHADPEPRRPARQEGDAAARGGVEPLDVVDKDRPAAPRRRAARRPRAAGHRVARRPRRQQARRRRAGAAAPPGPASGSPASASTPTARSTGSLGRRRRLQQGALADPRRALDPDRAAGPRAHRLGQRGQAREALLAARAGAANRSGRTRGRR